MNKFISGLFLSTVLIGCQPVDDSRGYHMEALNTTKIKEHKDTKRSVLEKLGSPSIKSAFSGKAGQPFEDWYYIAKKAEREAFFAPEVKEQLIVKVRFNKSGRLVKIQKLNKVDAHDIQPCEDSTESKGYETSLLREVFGNFGKYGVRKSTY